MVGITHKEFELIPAGTFPFRCYAVIDLGTQKGQFEGTATENHQIVFLMEFPTKLMKDGKPFALKTRTFNISWGDKAKLKQFLTSWLPTTNFDDKFDFGDLIGKTGLGNIGHEKSKDGSKTYANFLSVMPLPEGMSMPAIAGGALTLNDPIYVSLDNKWDKAYFDRLSTYWQGIIEKSPEYQAIKDGVTSVKPQEEEIPF